MSYIVFAYDSVKVLIKRAESIFRCQPFALYPRFDLRNDAALPAPVVLVFLCLYVCVFKDIYELGVVNHTDSLFVHHGKETILGLLGELDDCVETCAKLSVG